MISMYNSLSGIISKKSMTPQLTQVCLQVQGIEWILDTSRTSLQTLPAVGDETRIYTYLIHREDAMYLCGFATEAERAMFLDLLKVDGIGPKQALKILSAIVPERLSQLLDAGDIDGLEELPGLGKKTAQKMVLALKGKLSLDSAKPATRVNVTGHANLGAYEDLATALVAMGYDRRAVNDVLTRLIPEVKDLPMHQQEQDLMRRAIIELS